MAEPLYIIASRWIGLVAVILLTMCIVYIFYAMFTKPLTTRQRTMLLCVFILSGIGIYENADAVHVLLSPVSPAPSVYGSSHLAKLVAATPAQYLVGLTYATDKWEPQHAVGTYTPSQRSIWIDANNAYEGVWFHEVGHHVWSYMLNDSEREQYAAYHNTSLPTNYSAKSVDEDFAESFAIYHGTMDGQVNSERWNFINNVTTRILRQRFMQTEAGQTLILTLPADWNGTITLS